MTGNTDINLKNITGCLSKTRGDCLEKSQRSRLVAETLILNTFHFTNKKPSFTNGCEIHLYNLYEFKRAFNLDQQPTRRNTNTTGTAPPGKQQHL